MEMSEERKLKKPLFVALDFDSDVEALAVAKSVSPYVGGFKVGPRLCLRYGGDFIRRLCEVGSVFIDCKFYDIPSTMEASIRAAFDLGAEFATVHAGSGVEALTRMGALQSELNETRPFKILAVTVLTSFSESSRPPHWSSHPLDQQVETLAQLVVESGLSGLVCSPQEVTRLRELFPKSFLVTPGIRPSKVGDDDQSRTMGPREALLAGASALVVGRPIWATPDPVESARQIASQLTELKS